MTRDEAIDTARDKVEYLGLSPRIAAQWINLFIALDMLKVDDPKTEAQKIDDIRAAWSEKDERDAFHKKMELAWLKASKE